MDMCKAARKNSRWIWRSLRQAQRLGTKIGEESVTDFFLLNLRKEATSKIKIKSFIKHDEAKNGSDWEWESEWWFTGPSDQWLGMRIQAKVISLKTDRYEYLHRSKQGTTPQVETLITAAMKDNKVPVYCLYSYWSTRKNLYKAIFSEHHPGLRAPDFGASIVDALTIRRLSRTGKANHLSDLLPEMRPLHHLFCPGTTTKDDLPEVVIGYLNRFRFGDSQNRRLSRQAPGYIYRLRELANSQRIVDEAQFAQLFPDDRLRTVTIFEQQ